MNQKELNIYFRKIRLLLPIYSKAEKQFLKDFKDSVFVFIEKNKKPCCTLPAFPSLHIEGEIGALIDRIDQNETETQKHKMVPPRAKSARAYHFLVLR